MSIVYAVAGSLFGAWVVCMLAGSWLNKVEGKRHGS